MFRYRRPSLKTALGVIRVKRQMKRSVGISQVEGWTKPSRVKQKLKYRAGLYSPAVRVIRQTAKGKLPTLFGLFDKKR
jgi:hypothetical protein